MKRVLPLFVLFLFLSVPAAFAGDEFKDWWEEHHGKDTVSAPEITTSALVGALALLGGGLAVVTDRRKKR